MDIQTQIERLIELAIVQRSELKQLVAELPQLREHLNAEIERVFEETEPQLRVELEDFISKQTQERTDAISVELKSKVDAFAQTLNDSAQAKYSALIAERAKNDDLLKQAEQNIAFAAQALPAQVKEIVTAELARFPRAGEIDQLRKEFAEPKGLNPRGKWSPDATYNKLDLVGYNGDSFVSNIDGNRERPSRTSESWTLNAARGTGGGGGLLSINDALGNPASDFTIVGAEGNNYVQKTLVAGANITITESPTAITIIGDEGQISLQDGTAAAPALFFTNDTDTGLYRPAANTLGISVSGTQIAYFDENGLTIPNAGVVAGGSIHAANGNANNPSHSFSGDQDTGFFRHQPNEIGIALGGTQYATLTSTTFSITPSVTVGGTLAVTGNATLATTAGGVTGKVTIGNGVGGNSALVLRGGSTQLAWQVGSNINNANALEFSPSTANGGTTFTSTVWRVDNSGNSTQSGNLTVSGTGTSSFANGALVKIGLPTNAPNTNLGGNLLQVKSAGGLAYITIGNGDVANATSYIGGASSYLLFGKVSDAGSLTEFARFVDSGNLLIGTTTDSNQKLAVVGASSAPSLTASGTALASFTPSGVGTRLVFGGDPSSPFCTWMQNRHTGIDGLSYPIAINPSGGNVLIGTTTDSGYKLDVSGTARVRNSTGSTGIANVEANSALTTQGAGGSLGFLFGHDTTANRPLIQSATGGTAFAMLLQPYGGNVLLGSLTDYANGRLQLATHTTSAGGIGFGTDTALYRAAAQSLNLDGASSPQFSLSVSGTQKARLESYSDDLYISTLTAGKSIILRSGNAATAITLDSSQRTILSGALRLNNAYTAGAVVTTGYVTIQDSTGTTYKIPVGT